MQTIGKDTVVAEIARGGAGVVYRARDPAIQRDVAIKVRAEVPSALDAICLRCLATEPAPSWRQIR